MMEVGVRSGASLRLWREYFPEETFIFGVDIRREVPRFVNDSNIKVLIMDATNADVVNCVFGRNGPEFDFFIDDGSHKIQDIEKTFLLFRERMSSIVKGSM